MFNPHSPTNTVVFFEKQLGDTDKNTVTYSTRYLNTHHKITTSVIELHISDIRVCELGEYWQERQPNVCMNCCQFRSTT